MERSKTPGEPLQPGSAPDMTSALRILAISSDPGLVEELGRILEPNGHFLSVVDGAHEVRSRCAVESFDAVLVESQPDPSVAVALCSVLQEVGLTQHPIIVLLRSDEMASLHAYRAAGATDFLALPLHPQLTLFRLQGLNSDAPSATGTSGFLSQEAFLAETTRRIPTNRNADRHLSVLSLSVHVEDPEFDWVGMETSDRDSIEMLMSEALKATFASELDLDSLGLHPSDVVLSWVRPDRVTILLPGLRRVQDAAKISGRFQERLARHSEVSAAVPELHSSLGIASCPQDGVDAQALVYGAQKACERAREDGRNCLAFHTHAMGQWAFERLTLERSLSDALKNDELRVFYQPRIDINTRQILGMEALVRWIHPQLGMVSPAQFIPLAEETGLITPIGEWVLAESCRQNRAWREAGLPPIRVSVNLSPVQFRNPNLHEVVVEALNSSGLDRNGLELEVTESMLMNDPKVTIATLRKLKEAGLKISIDDFGTGYSSLSYLKQFPIDSLKIDRSFVRDVTSNPDDAAIATAIILMGHSLKLNVVAEGVETESQLAFLRVLQCNEVQGYLFSPPVPAEKAAAMLARGVQHV